LLRDCSVVLAVVTRSNPLKKSRRRRKLRSKKTTLGSSSPFGKMTTDDPRLVSTSSYTRRVTVTMDFNWATLGNEKTSKNHIDRRPMHNMHMHMLTQSKGQMLTARNDKHSCLSPMPTKLSATDQQRQQLPLSNWRDSVINF
jgi:hypothetical protein